MVAYKEIAMNFNRSGTKYNPPVNWKPGDSLITVFAETFKRGAKKLKPRHHIHAHDEPFKVAKRLHATKLRGKGDHLTNQERFYKNRKRRK